MLKFLSGGIIGAGLALLIWAKDSQWLSFLGFTLFIVGLIWIINQEIDDAKENIKQEILDEVEEKFEERNL